MDLYCISRDYIIVYCFRVFPIKSNYLKAECYKLDWIVFWYIKLNWIHIKLYHIAPQLTLKPQHFMTFYHSKWIHWNCILACLYLFLTRSKVLASDQYDCYFYGIFNIINFWWLIDWLITKGLELLSIFYSDLLSFVLALAWVLRVYQALFTIASLFFLYFQVR